MVSRTCTLIEGSTTVEDTGPGLRSWPEDNISCILSGQSEFNLRAKSSTSLWRLQRIKKEIKKINKYKYHAKGQKYAKQCVKPIKNGSKVQVEVYRKS